MITGKRVSLMIDRRPAPIDHRPGLTLKVLDALEELFGAWPVLAVVVPADDLPLRRVAAGDVHLELQAGGQEGLGEEFTGVRRVELVPLVDAAAAVDERIAAGNE